MSRTSLLRSGPLIVLSLTITAGCAGSGTAGPPLRGTASAVSTRAVFAYTARMTTIVPSWQRFPTRSFSGAGWISAAAKNTALLYVANYGGGSVTIYDAIGKNQVPVGKITSGISGPEGLAVDARRRLYVTNTSNNTVTAYRPGQTTPFRTYSSGLNAPAGVAVGGDGTVYVSNLFGNNVVAYGHGGTTPTAIYSGLNFPLAVALDASNNLYVTYANGIEKFPSGSTQGTNLGISLAIASGITIDKAANIVVANQQPASVNVYPPGATQPSQVFAQEQQPNPIAFLHSEKRLYVGEPLANVINVYAYPSGTKVNTISNGVDFPAGVAVSPASPL